MNCPDCGREACARFQWPKHVAQDWRDHLECLRLTVASLRGQLDELNRILNENCANCGFPTKDVLGKPNILEENAVLRAALAEKDAAQLPRKEAAEVARLAGELRDERASTTGRRALSEHLARAQGGEAMTGIENCPIDCGDNSCLCAGPNRGGMRTNGGCRCSGIELRRSVQWWRRDATVVRAALAEAREGEALYKMRLTEKAAESQTWAARAGELAAALAEKDAALRGLMPTVCARFVPKSETE